MSKPVHIGKTTEALKAQIAAMAQFAPSDEFVEEKKRMFEDIERAGRLFNLDAGARFEQEVSEVIRQHGGQGRAVIRAAAIRFIAQAVGNLYGAAPEEGMVRQAVEENGPSAVRQAAAEMLRRGRENIRSPFGILRKRAWSIAQRKCRAW